MLRPFDADDNVEKYRTFAESFTGLAKAARKARIICRSDDDNNVFVLLFLFLLLLLLLLFLLLMILLLLLRPTTKTQTRAITITTTTTSTNFLGFDSIELNLVRSY